MQTIPKHLQKSTMEVRIPHGFLMRSLSVIASEPHRRRLTKPLRNCMTGLWKLSQGEHIQHRLIVHSLYDADLSCSCGAWSLVRCGQMTKNEAVQAFKQHLFHGKVKP